MNFTKLVLGVLLSVSATLALADPGVFIRDPNDGSTVSADGFMIVADVYGFSPGDQLIQINVTVGCGVLPDCGKVFIECNSMWHTGNLPLRVLGNWRKRICNPIQRPPKLVLIAEQGGSLQPGQEYPVYVSISFEGWMTRSDTIYVTAQ